MSAPEGLINSLYRAGNIGMKDIQAILTSFQAVPKRIDSDTDLELIVFDTEVRERIQTAVLNPGDTNPLSETARRDANNSYIREIPTQVTVYPGIHSEFGSNSFILTDKKFGGGMMTDGTYYQTVASSARFNPTTELTICGWLRMPVTVSDGFIVYKNSQYIVNVTGATTLSFKIGTKTALTLTFTPGVWFHFAATYKSTGSGQKLYKDSILVDSDSETGAIPTSSNVLALFGDGLAGNLASNGVVASWISILSKEASSSWITDHFNGILDTNAVTEIVTIPFVAHALPKPDCSTGLCQIN